VNSFLSKGLAAAWFLLLVNLAGAQEQATFDQPPGEAVEWLLAHNREYQKALADMEKARLNVQDAAADAFPQLSASATGTRLGNIQSFSFETDDGPSNLMTAAEDNYSLTLGATQLLFSGSVLNAIGVSRSYSQVAEHGLRATREALLRDFLLLYARLNLLEKLRQLNEDLVSQTQARYEDAKLLSEIGALSRFDLLRSEVEYLNSIPALREAENLKDEATRALALMLDLDPGIVIVTHDFSMCNTVLKQQFGPLCQDLPDVAAIDRDALIDFAAENRPETQVAEHSVEGYRRAVNVYRSQMLPTLAAFANWERVTSWDLFAQNDEWRNSWNAGLQVSVPIFTGFRTSAQIQMGKQDLKKARADQELLHDAIALDVETAMNELARRTLDMEAWQRNVEAASEGYAIAENRRASGAGSELELRDARNAMKAAELNRAEAEYNLLSARIQLAHALGMMDQTDYIDEGK
jgi:outer membrane protein